MNIARYYASIGFQVNTRDIQQVDRSLSLVESKLRAFQRRLATNLSFNVSRFNVDQRRLNTALGNALDIASTRTAFQVSRFVIDQGNLNRTLTRSLTEASRVASASANIRPNVQGTVARAAATGAAFGGIGLGRLGAAGLALVGGGYGLGALNRRNQEVVSAQLQTSAVAQQALGDNYTDQAGKGSFQYLRNLAQETGFNYLEAVPNYNKLVSGIVGAGGTLQQGQGIFKGFSELARVYKLGQVQQNRLFKGLSDVAGKDQLMSEELNVRLAA